MAAPGTPRNLYIQQGNGQVYLQWDLAAGATSYDVQRSADAVTYASVGTPTLPNYTDSTVTVGIQYWYKVAAVSSGGTSTYTPAQSIVPTLTGKVSLAQLREQSMQRADLQNSQFVTVPEWNSYLNQSAFELYDLLVNTYEDYFITTPYMITTDGSTSQYTLPSDFYKLNGVDLGLDANGNAWVPVNKFDFIKRNDYVFPSVTSNYLGVFNARYRLVGNTLMFIPTPSAGQVIRVWYTPRMKQLLADTDVLDGVDGWTEYVIVDAAIKALQKEESDVSVLAAEKAMLRQRIEESAMNRDAGQPDTISATRSNSGTGNGWSNGSWGGT